MSADPEWFRNHYDEAAQAIIDFCAGGGVTLTDRQVADVGCGDGIIDLGLMHKASPARLTGFDIVPVDTDALVASASAAGVDEALPDTLEFQRSEPLRLPAEDASFDVVISWSAFEHIADPVAVLREIRRTLHPQGVFFLQLWPFYMSEHGGHVWQWYDEPFPHLVHDRGAVAERLHADGSAWADYMLDEFDHLNRITVDDLQRAILLAGMTIRRFELLTNCVHVPPELMRYPLSELGVTGVKLLATPY